jgi:Putative prokaryotic signal transducing protein
MKRVFSTAALADAGHLRNLLEQAGIRCFIKHEQLSGGLGDLPFLECQPELWVVLDEQAPKAEAVIKEALTPAPALARAWKCPQCGEANEAHFAACWNCGTTDRSD